MAVSDDKVAELLAARCKDVHDSIWRVETHYTWGAYGAIAGIIVALTSNLSALTIASIVIPLAVVGVLMCSFGVYAVRREHLFFREEKERRDDFIKARYPNYSAVAHILDKTSAGKDGFKVTQGFVVMLVVLLLGFVGAGALALLRVLGS